MFDEDVNKADDMAAGLRNAFGSGMGFGEFMIILVVLIVVAWTVYLLMAHTPLGTMVRDFLANHGIMKKKAKKNEDEETDEAPRSKKR